MHFFYLLLLNTNQQLLPTLITGKILESMQYLQQ